MRRYVLTLNTSAFSAARLPDLVSGIDWIDFTVTLLEQEMNSLQKIAVCRHVQVQYTPLKKIQ
jgi:hypothetical protein